MRMYPGRGNNPNSRENLKPRYWICSAEDGAMLWGPYTRVNASRYLRKIETFNKSGKNLYVIRKEEP
jgi:hypothetical protein